MATSALNQNINTAAGLAQLATALFGGGETTTKKSGGTSTSTKQTQISQEGLKSLIQSMMEDQSTGLAKVASGGRSAGLYNASTQQLMVNDLISRASNAAALASSPTVTTTTETPVTQTTKQSGLLSSSGSSNMLIPLLGAGLLMKKDASGKSMFDILSQSVGGFFGTEGDGATASNFVLGDSSALGGSITGLTSDMLSPLSESTFQLGNLAGLVTSIVGEGGIDYGSLAEVGSGVIESGSDMIGSLKDTADDVIEAISGWFA